MHTKFLSWVVAGMAMLACSGASAQTVTWSLQSTPVETEPSAWARMAKLPDGSWLAAYTVYNAPKTQIRIKKSTDQMRTWFYLTQVGETGRNLDNANLLVLADGTVLLGARSVITGRSYQLPIFRSTDSGYTFERISQVDSSENTGGSTSRGLYEPFLVGLPDGTVACFYANEKHSIEAPWYSQVISERVSPDQGLTWGQEIIAVAKPGGARPGEPNVVKAKQGGYLAVYEVCGSEDCVGHQSWSRDGKRWSGEIGPAIPNTWQNAQAISLTNGTLLATSNSRTILASTDAGATWSTASEPAFRRGKWPAFYQTTANEVAVLMDSSGDYGQPGVYVRFSPTPAGPSQTTKNSAPGRWPHLNGVLAPQ